MIPIIIHYKDNKKDDGFDLKITLRSFARFMPGDGQIILVGDRHEWMSEEITHIPFRHQYANNKDANIMMACLKGASYLAIDQRYEGDVVVASDDCVLLQPYEGRLYFEERAFQFMEAFPARFTVNSWWERPYQSVIHCMTKGWPTDNCEAHVPQLLSIGSIMTLMDARIGESNLGAKTLMVNAERALGEREAESVIPHRLLPGTLTADNWNLARFCNWGPGNETLPFKELLLQIFPNRSRYENAI